MTQPPYPQHLNPRLMPAIAEDVAFFRKWGYLVIEDAITEAQVEILRTALDAACARGDSRQFIHQLLEEDEDFAFLSTSIPG